MRSPTAPSITVHQEGAAGGLAAGLWNLGFAVRNGGEEAVALLAAWLPHGKFRCEERAFEPPLVVQPDRPVRLDFDVGFDEQPGAVVENGFVILRLRWQDAIWRVLTRLTVTADPDGAPSCKTEVTTAHRVGFSAAC